MKCHRITGCIVVLGLLLASGCATQVRQSEDGEDPKVALEEARDEVRGIADGALRDLYAAQPAARRAVEGAAGYAVFSNFGMKLFVTGSGTGRGIAVAHAPRREVFMRMAEMQAGLGFGIKRSRQIWVFQSQAAFDRFVDSGFEFGSQAVLAAQVSGQGGSLAGASTVSTGVWLYQLTDDGLAAQLTVRGTRYFRDRGLN